MSAFLFSAAMALTPKLVVISGCGSRGVGLGIARQVLKTTDDCDVVVMARSFHRAASIATELGARAHAIECDVTSDSSCKAATDKIRAIGGSELLALVNNAGYAADLPWFPKPWPAEAASATLAVNLFGAHRLTVALLPQLLSSADGRVVMVSSGGGRLNMKRMEEERRQQLLLATDTLTWDAIEEMAATFTIEYETAAAQQSDDTDSCLETHEFLPFMSDSGFWLQSYGFSKACLASYCQILQREEPSLLCTTCSPGWVATEMSSTYTGDAEMRSIDEGGEVPAWLACGDRSGITSTGFFMPDRSVVSWVAD